MGHSCGQPLAPSFPEGTGSLSWPSGVSPGGSAVRTCLPMQETQEMQVWPLGGADPLQEGMATHSSIPAWRIPWTEEPGRLQSIGSPRVRHNWSNLARWHALDPLDRQRAQCQAQSSLPLSWWKGTWSGLGGAQLSSLHLSQIFLGGHNFWWKTYKKKVEIS